MHIILTQTAFKLKYLYTCHVYSGYLAYRISKGMCTAGQDISVNRTTWHSTTYYDNHIYSAALKQTATYPGTVVHMLCTKCIVRTLVLLRAKGNTT